MNYRCAGTFRSLDHSIYIKFKFSPVMQISGDLAAPFYNSTSCGYENFRVAMEALLSGRRPRHYAPVLLVFLVNAKARSVT